MEVLDTVGLADQADTPLTQLSPAPVVASALPRTVTIRGGRIGGEGRRGTEYAVVTADGFVPLPLDTRENLPPGTLVEVQRDEHSRRLITGDDES